MAGETSERAIQSFLDLRVWQEAMSLVEACYQFSAAFPKVEMFGLTAQLRRAAISVPANTPRDMDGTTRGHMSSS